MPVNSTAMVLIGLSWTAFGTCVLTRKRMLLARHRVIAGRMSVTFCAAFLLAALFAAYATGQASASAASAIAVLMLGIAMLMLRRAQRAVAQLAERRDTLARELTRGR